MATFFFDPSAPNPDAGGGVLLSPAEQAALAQAPKRQPLPSGAGQFWNLPAKFAAANQIKQEELAEFPGHNTSGDAMRHAEASRRLAEAAGPVFASAAGLWHEAGNSRWRALGGDGQPLSEAAMDLLNNSRGVDAAMRGVPVDPGRLQTRPLSLSDANVRARQGYQDASGDAEAYRFAPFTPGFPVGPY